MSRDPALPFEQQLDARRRAAMRKYDFARALQKHSEDLRRQAEREMHEIEIAERVFRDLPATESAVIALESSVSPEHLWSEAQMAAKRDLSRKERGDRNAAVHEPAARVDASSQSLRELVGDICVHLLQDGSWKSTEELYAMLQSHAVPLGRVQNPVQRVSQILSMDARFKNQRGRGWALATAEERDEWDENMKRRTRIVLDKDNSAR